MTTLYRAFNAAGDLLYIGIAERWPSRWTNHARQQPWFAEVARLDVEEVGPRALAEAAEKAAIIAERPRHNVMHNRTGRRPDPVVPPSVPATGWNFRSVRSDYPRTGVSLNLVYEIDCSTAIDEVDDEDDAMYFAEYIKKRHPEWWSADKVPIIWFIEGAGTFEAAPRIFQPSHYGQYRDEDFLTHFTWPEDADGTPVNFYELPVVSTRRHLERQLRWRPSPFQETCPLQSIYRSLLRSYQV